MRTALLVALIAMVAVSASAFFAGDPAEAARSAPDGCVAQKHDRAKLVCTSTTERIETTDVTMVSGCVAGPTGVPGRRTRVFRDTYLVTETTTTGYKNNNQKKVVFTRTEEAGRQFISRQEISSTCEPLGGAA